MPKIKITKLPKYILGGEDCPEGFIYDQFSTECIPDPNYSPSAPFKETKEDGPGEYEEVQKFNVNPILSTGTPKTGPGTGVNPSTATTKKKKMPFFSEDMTTADKVGWFENTAGLLGIGAGIWADDKKNRERKEAYDKNFRFNQFNPAAQGRDKGNWTADSQKIFKPNQYTINEGMMNRQFGGGVEEESRPSTVKIKIIDGPEPFSMKYGGQFKGSYGFDVGWRNLYTDMSKTSSDHYTDTMSQQKNPDEDYALEAEGGEVIYKPGDHTSHTISGPDHSQGGVKLTDSQVSSKTAPDVSSFIFSKTKALAIKDPEILSHFGITNFNKSGVVPAKIAKMFEINKYKTIIEDPNKDDLAKRTAALMLDRNEKYLAELSVVQEGMKGKEAPEFAQTILGGEKAEAKYGGWFKSEKLRKFVGGGSEDAEAPNDIKPWAGDKYGKRRKGKPGSNASRYTKKQWKEKLKALGFNGPWDNLSVQEFLYKIPEAKAIIDKYHGTGPEGMGQPKGGMFDEILGKRWDEALESTEVTTTTTLPVTLTTTLPPGKITIKTPPVGTPPTEEPKFICIVDKETGYKIVESTVGYDSYEEAAANCGKTATPPPFDFTTPDKVAMLATAIGFPRKDYPTIANKNYERGTYALNDWAAAADRAFNTQFLAPSRAMAAYTPAQGLTSNMMAASGQAADTIVGNVIPTITGQNVGIFNQFSANEQQRKDAIDDYNAKAQVARDEGRARTEQTGQQELVDYAARNAEQFGKSWVNRYKWYDQGFANPNFYKDPRTGKTIYRNTGGYSGTDDDGSDVGSMGSSFNSYYKKFYDDMSDIKDPVKRDAEARRMAGRAVGAGKVSKSGKDPYDFYGGRTRSTSYNLPDEQEEEEEENPTTKP